LASPGAPSNQATNNSSTSIGSQSTSQQVFPEKQQVRGACDLALNNSKFSLEAPTRILFLLDRGVPTCSVCSFLCSQFKRVHSMHVHQHLRYALAQWLSTPSVTDQTHDVLFLTQPPGNTPAFFPFWNQDRRDKDRSYLSSWKATDSHSSTLQ
jgi:hypothetical protein